MPPIVEVYDKYKEFIKGLTFIRLHGPDRSGMEKLSGKQWDKIYINRDKELRRIVEVIKYFQSRDVEVYQNVNNHYEGSVPLTISKVKKMMK